MEFACRPGFKTPENKHPRYVDIDGRSLLWAPIVHNKRRLSRPTFEANELWTLLNELKSRQTEIDAEGDQK